MPVRARAERIQDMAPDQRPAWFTVDGWEGDWETGVILRRAVNLKIKRIEVSINDSKSFEILGRDMD